MTDLLSRSSTKSTPRGAAGRPKRRFVDRVQALLGGSAVGAGGGPSEGRPLTVSAALAALGATGTALVICMGVALIGWFLADAGAHGETTDALLVGADAWLVGHGATLTVSGAPLGIVPLTVTALIAVVVHRFGKWAAATSQPVDDDRILALSVTIFTGLYVVIAVVTTVLVSQDGATPSLGRAIGGSLVLSALAGGLGMAGGTGRLRARVAQVPGWVRSIAYGAAAATLLVVAASAVLVAAALATGLNEAAAVLAGLRLGAGDYVVYAVATAAVAPNAVLFGAAYLLGPGFAVGTGTVVSPTVVALGPVPAFPLLAALPGSGSTPSWAPALMLVPALAAVVGAVLAQRAYRVTAYDSAALRGFGCGFGAALVTTLAIALAGGPMGTGRMADIGAPVGEVLVSAVMSMSLGGLVAGVVTAWWQRR